MLLKKSALCRQAGIGRLRLKIEINLNATCGHAKTALAQPRLIL